MARFVIFLSFASLFGLAFPDDGLGVSRFQPPSVRLQAVPLQAKPEPAPVVPDGGRPDVKELSFLAPQRVFLSEMERWLKGSPAPNLRREPIAGGSVGRWVSLGGMALPSISVSKVSWVPQIYAQETPVIMQTAEVKKK